MVSFNRSAVAAAPAQGSLQQQSSAWGRMCASAVLTLAALGSAAADAGELRVTATVRKHASVQVLAQPGTVHITRADIERGYVDVSTPVQLVVKSNTQEGYLLVFDHRGEFFRHALVRGLSNDVQVGAGGGTVAQRATGSAMGPTMLALAFRFELASGTSEGTYPWPVQLSALPM